MTNGIDVSHHKGAIDWTRVAKAGVKFAYIKATEAAHFIDDFWRYNVQHARENGIVVGLYHFWRPYPSGREQAEHFLRTCGDALEGMLIPMLDVEQYALARRDIVARTMWEWLTTVEREIGRKPGVYANSWWCRRKIDPDIGRAGYPLWLAWWRSTPPNVSAERPLGGWTSWLFWQYTNKGRVDGIRGRVDMDKFAGTEKDLERWAVGHVPRELKVVLLPENIVIPCRPEIKDGTARCDLRPLAEALGYNVHAQHIPRQGKIYLTRRR